VFVTDRIFQDNILFVVKVRSLFKNGAPEMCFAWVGSGLTYKHLTCLERPNKNAHIYWAHIKVTKKIKCCDYSHSILLI
jgi:hypothetical protein